MRNNKELVKMVKENPELPIVTATYYEVCSEDWGYWCGEIENIEVDYYYIDDERWYAGKEEIINQIAYHFEDQKECEFLSDEQFDSFVNNKFEEYLKDDKIKKAIIIFISV